MASDELRTDRLDHHLRTQLREDVPSGERLSTVVSDAVPARLPGRLLLKITDLAQTPVPPEAAIDAAVAVEFATLHQYLHAVPAADADLVDPAASSPYADDVVAAIVDGDFLQASAFTRLSAAAQRVANDDAWRPDASDLSPADPSVASTCYRLLSHASVNVYEGRADARETPPAAALVEASARIGALFGGVEADVRDTVAAHARAIGTATPVRSPTGWVEGASAVDVQRRARTLANCLADSRGAVDRFERFATEAIDPR